MRTSPSLPLLQCPLWPGVVASDRSNRTKLYLCQTELFEKEPFLTLKLLSLAKINCLK